MTVKLTKIQLATLEYICQKCEITTYHPSTGSLVMKNLVKFGFLRVLDSSYGSTKQQTWIPTLLGKSHAETNRTAARAAIYDFGRD
jgi:hypothetical protein